MVTYDPDHLQAALTQIASIRGVPEPAGHAGAAAPLAAAGGAHAHAHAHAATSHPRPGETDPDPARAAERRSDSTTATASSAASASASAPALAARCTCPWCGLQGLSVRELWLHQPLYHIYEPDLKGNCPACGKFTRMLTRHMNMNHGPQPLQDERTGVFALAVVRRPYDGKFLLVQERYNEGYWLPGGGVDEGETLVQGAVREAEEEAGCAIVVKAILTIESMGAGSWRRVIFYAEPIIMTKAIGAAEAGPPAPAEPAAGQGDGGAAAAAAAAAAASCVGRGCKTLPDVESAGACWCSADELAGLPLRSPSEPCTWIPWVAQGGEMAPLEGSSAAGEDLARIFPDFKLR